MREIEKEKEKERERERRTAERQIDRQEKGWVGKIALRASGDSQIKTS